MQDTEVNGVAMDVAVGNLPELEGGDLVIAALVLHLPEHLVQVQLLVCKGGHLVLALGTPVPVDEKACEGVLVQPTHQIQHFLSHIAILRQEAWLVTIMIFRHRHSQARSMAGDNHTQQVQYAEFQSMCSAIGQTPF